MGVAVSAALARPFRQLTWPPRRCGPWRAAADSAGRVRRSPVARWRRAKPPR